MFKGLVIGFIIGILACVGGAYYYFSSGMAPAAVADPQMPFERKMAGMALDAHIQKQNIGQPPIAVNEANLLAGAQVYKQNCATCHGLPGQPVEYVDMMFPKPTQLFKGKGVTDDPPSETYWKAANGIRLSGMPSFKNRLSDTQLWQVSLLVAHANQIPDSVKSALQPPATPPPSPSN